MKVILNTIFLIGIFNFSLQSCLKEEELRDLGLTPLTSAQDISNPPICGNYYESSNAKTCVDLNLMKDNVQQFGKKYSDIFADEQYEIIANFDLISDSFFSANAEIQVNDTYDGKPVSDGVKDLFNEANEWIDLNDVDYRNVGKETSECNIQSQKIMYGAYCFLSGDKAAGVTISGGSILSKNSEEADSGRILADDQTYSSKIAVAMNDSSAEEFVGKCINNIKSLCTYYYMRKALKGAENESIPNYLEEKCFKSLMSCKSNIQNTRGESSSSTGCSSGTKSTIINNFFGGFTNKMVDANTRDQFSVKGTGTALTRKILWEKMKNFGIGKSFDKEMTLKERRDQKVSDKQGSSSSARRMLETTTTVNANLDFSVDPVGYDLQEYGSNSGFETYANVFILTLQSFVFFSFALIK